MLRTLNTPALWLLTLSAAGLLMVTMGIRQSLGLFVAPLDQSAGFGIAAISLAMAVGQFIWGLAQPIAGAFADRYGPAKVLACGLIILAIGNLITPFMTGVWGLIFSLGVLSAAGSGAGSFAVLIGAVSHRIPVEGRGMASGIINAGGSFGQFIFAPITQKLIQVFGWAHTLWALAGVALAALPLVRTVTATDARAAHGRAAHAASHSSGLLRQCLATALSDRSYWLLNAGFFTCGFHIAFLVTHLPGEVNLCGLPPTVASWSLAIIGAANIFGSLFAGACVARFRSKYVLFWMYGSRAVLIALYLISPRTDLTFYLFAAGLGFTWLATVPPTAGIIGKLFDIRHLGTLFGLSVLAHQIGGFLGAWLGGLAITRFGDYAWMWYADMALAGLAALVNLPIREYCVRKASAPA